LKPLHRVRALLLAGLFLFQPLALRADDLPPARSPLMGASPAAVELHASDLKDLHDQLVGLVQDRVGDQAQRLSRTAEQLEDLKGELRSQAQSAKALDASLSSVGSTLGELDKRVAALGQAAAAKDVDAAGQAARLKGLSDDLSALRLQTDASAKAMRDGLADIATLREDLKQRQARLDSLSDLLAVMKKGVDENSEEIVEVKQSLKRLEQAPSPESMVSGDWWDQALQWKYLPALAVGLSAVALGVAATHQ
jgi:chromosome segregation ATPase